MPTLAPPAPFFLPEIQGSSASPLDVLRGRQGTLLPFDNTVCAGKRGARLRSAAYVFYQALEFGTLLATRPFERETYERFVQPWGLTELIPGAIYRSAEPRELHLPYLQTLGINTLVCVKRTLPSERTIAHALDHDLNLARIDLGPDGNIEPQAIQRALDLLLRPELWPILLHCDGGRHRTGIVTAALRRAQGVSLEPALEEYERYAAPTPRVSDGAAIARYFAARERVESST